MTKTAVLPTISKPKSSEDIAGLIVTYGQMDRRIKKMNGDHKAVVAKKLELLNDRVRPLQTVLDQASNAIEAYCNTHRVALTDNNPKKKTVDFGTVKVSWTAGRVTVDVDEDGLDELIEWLTKNEGKHCLRTETTVSKDGLKVLPAATKGEVPHVTVARGDESFKIKPKDG